MRRVLLVIAFAFALTASAQDKTSLQFVDEQGNTYTDGSTVTVNTVKDDPFEGVQIASGLYLKNVYGDKVGVKLTMHIDSMPTGKMQVCCMKNCTATDGPDLNKSGVFDKEVKDNMQWEWFPNTYGTATATVTTKLCKVVVTTNKWTHKEETSVGDVICDGPSLTVNFVYADPASVKTIEADRATVVARYNADGQRISAHANGLVIERLANGATRKEIRKTNIH